MHCLPALFLLGASLYKSQLEHSLVASVALHRVHWFYVKKILSAVSLVSWHKFCTFVGFIAVLALDPAGIKSGLYPFYP
jgi:hypothetical protein